MTLRDLKLNDSGVVLSIESRNGLAQRLMSLGLLPGTKVRVVQVAPFGDPITVELDDWRVSLRRADAASVNIHQPATEHA